MKSVLVIIALLYGAEAITKLPAYADPAEGGDPFMNKVLGSYSTQDKKTGRYWTSREQALELSKQTMVDNLKELPYWAQQHIDVEFPKTWNHFDVLWQNKIPAEQVPQFLRMMSRKSTI